MIFCTQIEDLFFLYFLSLSGHQWLEFHAFCRKEGRIQQNEASQVQVSSQICVSKPRTFEQIRDLEVWKIKPA